MSTRVGAAHLDLTVLTAPARRELTAFAANARALLTGLSRPVKIEVKADAAQVRTQVDAVKAEFTNLQNSLKNVLKVDVSALKSVISKIGKQITDLTALETKLRALGNGGSGGGGTGAGGGSPGVNNQYAAQLRGLQADLKNSALSTAQFELATRNLKTTIDSEIASLRAAGPLTQAQQARLDALRVSSAQAGTALKGLADQQARATREAARGAERTQVDGVRRLATELQNAQSRYDRGALSLRGYLREMQRIQAAGSGMASGLTAGSRAATDLERVMGGLNRATRGLNDASITKIRTDLAAARAEFERATAAAGRFGDKRAAIQAYEASMRSLETRIRSVGERATITARQTGELGRISTNIRSSLNSLNSSPSGVGLAGSIMAALKQLPQFAAAAGGSLGAAAAQATSLSGGLMAAGGAAAKVNPILAALVAVVAGLVAVLASSIGPAAQFQQTLTDIKALTQPTTAELERLRQATFDVGKPLGVGARDAAAAVLELNKAGLSAKDAVGGGLKGALDLAGAAGISAAEGATIAVSAMTAFGLQAQQLPGVADVFANFANKTFLGAQDLSQAIAAVGPVARDAGIGLEQFAGLMATLAQGGFKNMSDAGTSLKTMLLSLTAPSSEAAKALRAVNVSAFDSKGQTRPLNAVLADLRAKLVQLTPEAQKGVLKQIFGTDAIRAAQILLREGPRAINANTEAMRKQGEAARVAKERLDSLQGAGKQFGAAFEQLKIQIGTPFLAALTGIVRGATGAVNALTSLNDQAAKGQGPLAGLRDLAQALGSTFGSVFAGIAALWNSLLAPVFRALGAVVGVVLQGIVTGLTAFFNLASAVFQGVGTAIQALLGVFGTSGAGIQSSATGMAETVVQGSAIMRAALVALGRFTATLPEVFKLAGTGIGTVLGGVTRVMQGFGQGVRAVFVAAGGYVGAFASAVGRNVQGIGLILKGLTGIFGALLLAVRNAFVEKAGVVLAAGVRLYGQFTDGVANVLQQGAAYFFRYVVQPVQAGADFLLTAYNRVSGIVAGAATRIGQVLAPIGSVLKALGLSIGDTLAGVAKAAVDTSVGIVDRFAGSARAAYERAQAAAQAAATSTASSTATGVANALTGASGALGDFVKDNGAGSAMTAALGDVQAGFKAVSSSGQQLQKDIAGVTGVLKNDLTGASGTAAAGLGEIRTGAQLTGAAVDLVKRNVQDAVQGFTQDVKTLGQTAKATAAAVGTIKPPAVMPTGTKTLDDIGLGDDKGGKKGGAKGAKGNSKVTAADLNAMDEYKRRLDGMTLAELRNEKALQTRLGNTKKLAAVLAEIKQKEAEATRQVQLSGAALTKYKEALRAKSAEQLKALEADARAKNLGPQLNAILAEQKRRTEAKAAADRKASQEAQKHATVAANLRREVGQLNDRFKLQVQQGKVTAESLLAYRQALADAKAKVDQLPPALRASVTALVTQGQTLAAQGQTLVNHRSEVEKLRAEVDKWTLAALENARARVMANGGDKDKLALLDAEIAKRKQLSDAQAAQVLTESQLSQATANQEGAEGEYENRKAAAKGNLSELLAIEIQLGQKVQAARDKAARAAAANEERQIRERYGKLLGLEGLTAQRRKELESARDRELTANGTRLTNALAKNATDRAVAEEDARRNLNATLEGLDREVAGRIRANLLADLEQRTRDVEAQQQEELDAEGLTEAQKLEIRKRFQPQLLAAKQSELDQVRAIEEVGEQERYRAALAEAEQQGILDQRRLQADGSYLTVRQLLEKDHRAEMDRIGREAQRSLRDYELEVKRDTGRQIVAADKETSAQLKDEADDRIQALEDNLDDQSAAQRAAARTVLQAWRVTYAAMGKSGEEAVKQIDAALRKLDAISVKIRQNAGALVEDPAALLSSGAKDVAAVGKPDDADSARAKAESQFDQLAETYSAKLAVLKDALAAFAEKKDQDLTPNERLVRDGLLATQAAYTTLLSNVRAAAAKAGADAAQAFTQAQKDQAAESALALVEAQHALAEAEGRDDGPAYKAGIAVALAYWRGRLAGLKAAAQEGTPEYLNVLKTITDLEGKIAATGNPVGDRLSMLAGLIGKGGKLQGTISAGLDGLAAYLKNGGGKGGLIAGAQALVSGLAGVFKTGDEDIDKVIDTFVSGVQATLGALAKGDWIGALIAGVTTVVTTIIDIFTGGANSAKKAAQQISDATKDVKFFDLSKYAKVESRGGFWGFLGFKKASIDQEAVDIAKSLGDALYSAISGAMLKGIKEGKRSFGELGLDVREGLGQQILQGLIDGFLKGAIMQGILQPFLDKYIAAMKSGNAQALAEAANGLQGAIAQGNSALAQFYETVLVPAAEQMGQFGTDGQSAGGTGSAALDLGLAAAPAAVAAAPAYMVEHTTALTELTPVLRDVTRVFGRLADDGLHVEAESTVTVNAPTSDLRAYATRS
ncbi:phage tail tape measure protein, TP901 family [Deinococcus grandis]|uniref:Phage tail tape measure protein, TP901 family n=1 Tax=Deinococcus grandis TaxID=57498 RepID=A0A100HNC7_9DEIO|nr:phage tail tape measure protein [Deinococcus grandis]GAQ23916.1 phage tail tape measure protein, TP901 family [Deinococcus grandis]